MYVVLSEKFALGGQETLQEFNLFYNTLFVITNSLERYCLVLLNVHNQSLMQPAIRRFF